MNLHEYQSKALFAEYGIAVPKGIPASSADEAVAAAAELGGELWVVGNRHLRYDRVLKTLFSSAEITAANRKFVVTRSVK